MYKSPYFILIIINKMLVQIMYEIFQIKFQVNVLSSYMSERTLKLSSQIRRKPNKISDTYIYIYITVYNFPNSLKENDTCRKKKRD